MLTTLPSPSAQTIRQSVPDQEDIIRRSLERSARYGVDPHLDGAPESTRLSDEQLRERINGQRVFYTLAKEQIDSLYRLLRDTGFCMALADSEGYVLYVVGDSDLVEHFKRRRCIPGYRWTERDIGTCAIGLSLEERVPVFLPGDRMYSAQARKISNAGAPVFSLDGGRVLGAISLSGGSDMMHIHTLGLVRQAAETVTSQLRETHPRAGDQEPVHARAGGIRFPRHRHRGSDRAHRGGQQHGPQAAEAFARLRGQVL